MTMYDRQDKPNLLVYLAYLGVFAIALNTVFIVLPSDQLKITLIGLLAVAVMTGYVLSPRHYVAIGLTLDLAGLLVFVYYGWRIFEDKASFGSYLGEMLSVMLVLRTFKLFRHYDFMLPLIISLTLIVFAAIPSFSAEFVYNLFAFLLFLGLALFLGNIDEFARLPKRRGHRSAFAYTYDFLDEYKSVPLSQVKPSHLLRYVKPALRAGLPAVLLSILISSGLYFCIDHTQAPGTDAALLAAFEAAGIETDLDHQTDLLTGMRTGGSAQYYPGFDTEFNIASGRLVENSTSTRVVMEVESNLPSYWRGKAFDVYTGRGWRQSDTIRTASWSLNPPTGDRTLYHGEITEAEVASAGIKPDPELERDQVRQIFHLQSNLPGIVFTAYQPIELSMPVPALKIDDTFTLYAPPAADSMVAGQVYEVTSLKHFAQGDELRAHDYNLADLSVEEPDFYLRYTQLPTAASANSQLSGFDFSRVRAKAYEVTAGMDTVYDRVDALINWLDKNYSYSLNPPAAVAPEKDAVDYFLFDWGPRRGHCEYFSSSLAVLCRSIGIPARVVTGYATGTYNLLKNRYIVQERHAHAWVEVFWPDMGWVEFDPTPRTWYQGIGEDISGGWVVFQNAMEELYVYNPRGYFRDKILPVLGRLLNRVHYFTNQRELDLADSVAPLTNWARRDREQAYWVLASAFMVLLLSSVVRRKRDLERDRLEAIRRGSICLRRVGKRLARQGVTPVLLATEMDYALQASRLSPEWGGAVGNMVDKYQEARYSGRKVGPVELRNLKRACRATARK